MNDPHVQALIYRVEHGQGVNYDRAEPLEFDLAEFHVRVEENRARLELCAHYSEAETARRAVEPFIHAWELSAGLEGSPDDFRIAYDSAEIIDRSPTPGVHSLVPTGISLNLSAGTPTIVVGRISYPSPPQGLHVSPDVVSMYDRYRQFLQGKEPISSMAYFCLTVLEAGASQGGRRAAAAKMYHTEKAVLDKLGELTAKKGGASARKADGISAEFTSAERKWVTEALKKLIRRAAEVAHDSAQDLRQITLSDLPSLEQSPE